MTSDKAQMSPERWIQIKQVFYDALEREPGDRSSFLDGACRGDDEMRREVESLLNAHELPDSLIDKPAFEVAADFLATREFTAAIGRVIGPYKILQQIGRGGMGEVYLAQDTRLGRRVALKLLPSRFTSDDDRLRRFKQEARAASSLNHPNIITIHEVGQADDVHFIATEFVEGATLRSSIESGGMRLYEALEIVIQVASALRAAHEAGIVHRDIKPENIMLRPDGYVKVVDFGLAKLSERSALTDDGVSFSAIDTNPGVVMGTVSYMSPEQARGLAVDARGDIYSLGVVLYEMLAGRPPFQCATISDLIVAILEKEPPALSSFTTEASEDLESAISKALRKNQDDRYQTSKEMLDDLRKLKQDVEIQARIDSGSAEEFLSGGRTRASGAQASGTAGGAVTGSNVAHITDNLKLHKRGLIVALTVLLVIAATIAGVLLLAVPPKTIDSIAVMPFANVGGDPSTEYLPDGITESLINSLSRLPGLRVMARGTVFTYKDREVDPRRIADDLKVRALVMGTYLQRGQMLTITAELIDASDGSQLWGKQYNTAPSRILGVQESISQDITERLRSGLSSEETKRFAKNNTNNNEAYELYLRGRYQSERFTLEGFNTGVAYFNQAIEKDPNYALAYAGLAYAYYSVSSYYLTPNEAWMKSREAAKKAVELDDTVPEAHVSLGIVLSQFERDWAGAEKEFKRAIELNPNYAAAHLQYGWLLTVVGRFDESDEEFKRAQQLDPFSTWMNGLTQLKFWLERRPERAIELGRKAIEREPNLWLFHMHLAMTYEQQGRLSEAMAALEKARSLDDSTSITAMIARIHALSGREGDARKMLDELKEQSKQRWVSPYTISIIYLGLGEIDEAFAWLEKGYESRDEWMLGLKNDSRLDSLRSDPRFQNLMQRMGFK
jgi:eukaryotic-like serine/threonine-protein kinase